MYRCIPTKVFSNCYPNQLAKVPKTDEGLTQDFSGKLTFKKNSFRNTITVSNSLYPDQDLHFFSPDLGPNCLQSYQQTTKVSISRERGNIGIIFSLKKKYQHFNIHVAKLLAFYQFFKIMIIPSNKGKGGHIFLGADLMGFGWCDFYLYAKYLVN